MAVSYAQNQWQALRRYTEDGRLSIDNNVSERTLRHQAIGRKNWLFPATSKPGPAPPFPFTILAGVTRASDRSHGRTSVNSSYVCMP